MSERDIELGSVAKGAIGSYGRSVIAVIGIDRYQSWRRLTNAVGDARGAAALFGQLGFEQITEPLIDGAATGEAIEGLVKDDLKKLGPDDNLVLFYAGHGGTQIHRLGDQVIKLGHLIPVDASDRAATWVELDSWLRAVSLLPARHILVILDACHSGIALGPIARWRDSGMEQDTPLRTLNARRSRRIITSALDDQVALDNGPVRGHSLFTGCLIEGISYDLKRGGSRMTTGSELGLYLQRRVETYPGSRQTPDFGTFDFDDRGEMALPLVIEHPAKPDTISELILQPESSCDERFESVFDTEPHANLEGASSRRSIETEPELPFDTEPHYEIPASTAAIQIAWTPDRPAGLVSHEYTRERVGIRSWRWLALVIVSGAALALLLPTYNGVKDEYSPRLIDAISKVTVDAAPAQPAFDDPRPVEEPQTTGAAPGSCPADMVWVSPGTFRITPQSETKMLAYCIDVTEVTVKAYEVCVKEKGCSAAALTVRRREISEDEAKLHSRWCNRENHPDHPMNCVDWDQAAAYCKWAGKRLPTEVEWEYAARGSDDRLYPWGNERPNAKLLNACGDECASAPMEKMSWDIMYKGNDGWPATAPVGSYPAGASPFGALDMAGNVQEWTANWPAVGGGHVAHGGGWSSVYPDHVEPVFREWLRYPTDRDYDVGFRCMRGG